MRWYMSSTVKVSPASFRAAVSTEAVPVISLKLESVALPLLVTMRMLPAPDLAAS